MQLHSEESKHPKLEHISHSIFVQQWIGLSNILQITYMHVLIYTLLELHLHAYSALITIEIQI